MRPYHIAWIFCGIAAIVFLGLIAVKPIAPPEPSTPQTVAGVKLGGPFTLTDQNGKQVTDRSWPGKYLLIYFGFTHCPDICPVGLNRIAEALKALSPEQREQIQPIFITVDPERDTVKTLKEYVVLFDKNLVGLTGSVKDIKHVQNLYKVYAQKNGTGDDYMVNHSGYTYLMNPKGELANIFAHETTSDELAEQLKKAVSSGSSSEGSVRSSAK